jgi:predicted  nucleic acid-binding Zn-ribbon protein
MTAHKIEDIKMKQNNSYEIRIALLEQSNANINETLKDIKQGLNRLENKIDSLDKKIDDTSKTLRNEMHSQFSALDKKIDSIHSRIWHLFLCGVGAFAGMLTLIAHAEKWI